MNGNSLEDQVSVILRLLKGKKYNTIDSQIWRKALEWISNFPEELAGKYKVELMEGLKEAFSVTEAQIMAQLAGEPLPSPIIRSTEDVLDRIIPPKGWLRDYVEYTKNTMSPLSYHVFCGLTLLGTSLGKRCKLDFGFFEVFPNLNTILVGPTGKVKKTSAVDIAKGYVHDMILCPIFPDKITPEALALALAESPRQFVYAPEFSIFFGKQRYNEGLTTLMIRLLDNPLMWSAKTITRGDVVIQEPFLHIIGGSTMSLLSSSTPDEVSSGGFLNRFVVVVEHTTNRVFPVPTKGAEELDRRIKKRLKQLLDFSGTVVFSRDGLQWYDYWFRQQHQLMQEMEESEAELAARNDQHVLKVAMLIHLSDCGDLELCSNCLQTASKLINYTVRNVPELSKLMNRSGPGKDSSSVLNMIRKLGGAIDHSTLVRRMASKMNTRTLKGYIDTLEEAGQIKISKKGLGKYYVLIGETKDADTGE